MKLEEIVVLERAPAPGEGYFGGGCQLPAGAPWPKDRRGRPCMHLATFPCRLFEHTESARFISIFIPYAGDDYYKEIRGTLDENYTHVLIHANNGRLQNRFSDPSVISQAKAIVAVQRNEDDAPDICGSKVFNVPAWLQGEEIIPGHGCRISIYGNDFSTSFEESRGLFADGIVFIFVRHDYKSMADGASVGKVLWQL